MALKFILIAIVFVAASEAQVAKIGTCSKDIKGKADFKAADFAGDWYEVKRYSTILLMGQCVAINYKSDKKSVTITTSQTMPGANATTAVATHGLEKENGEWTYKTTFGLGEKLEFPNI